MIGDFCAVEFEDFNSIKVRLKPVARLVSWSKRPNFNSIKVRLKLKIVLLVSVSVIFQFHKGTIKTRAKRKVPHWRRYFNSIKVRLKLWRFKKLTIKFKHFNSIKVRLKPDVGAKDKGDYLFQFHKGTIKTDRNRQRYQFTLNFNSIKVRLKLFIVNMFFFCTYISIP